MPSGAARRRRTSRRGRNHLPSPSRRGHSAPAYASTAQGRSLAKSRPERRGRAAEPRASCRSLLALRPYLARHLGMVLAAFVALVASAAAMLTVPVAVRRMIDVGFAGPRRRLHRPLLRHADRHRPGAGAGERGAHVRRQLAGRAGGRRSARRRVPAPGHPGSRLLRQDPLRRGDEPPDGRHHADQGGGRRRRSARRCATSSC